MLRPMPNSSVFGSYVEKTAACGFSPFVQDFNSFRLPFLDRQIAAEDDVVNSLFENF